MPAPRPILLAVAIATFAFAASVSAHGGMYRPPGDPNLPGGPATPVGGPALPGGPNTGGGASSGFINSWSWWWDYNKERYLRLKELVRGAGAAVAPLPAGGPQTSTPVPARGGLGPTAQDLTDRVLPALKRLIDSSDNADIQTACMIAMAKVGVRHPEIDILAEFRRRLSSGNQEVRETAALSLGLAGLAEAADDLVALIGDEARGRELVGRGDVDERCRAFATYGLALLARRDPGVALRRRAFDVFVALLAEDRKGEPIEESREVRVAAWQGLGVLRPDPSRASDKRLLWEALGRIDVAMFADIRAGEEIVRAHVPTAAVRLLGRGDTVDHRRVIERLVELVDPRAAGSRDQHFLLEQSAALALGEIALPPETDDLHATASEALRRYFEDGRNQDARKFAAVALGRIGGVGNRDWLLRAHRGGKSRDQAWLVVALGVLVRDAMDRGDPPDTFVLEYLARSFRTERNDEHRGAVAVMLGLCRYQPIESALVVELESNLLNEAYSGDIAIGLGLLGTPKAVEALRFAIDASTRRPQLLARAAMGLALANQPDTVPRLIALLADASNLMRLAGVAVAFRYVGDRRAIDPLIERMSERNEAKLTLAFVAAALGGVADKDLLPWNEPFAAGCNYFANVPTLRDGVAGILDIL